LATLQKFMPISGFSGISGDVDFLYALILAENGLVLPANYEAAERPSTTWQPATGDGLTEATAEYPIAIFIGTVALLQQRRQGISNDEVNDQRRRQTWLLWAPSMTPAFHGGHPSQG
jgi:hypothetical protein